MVRKILTHLSTVMERILTVHHAHLLRRFIAEVIAEREHGLTVETQRREQLRTINLRHFTVKMMLYHFYTLYAPMIVEMLREKEKQIFYLPPDVRRLLIRYGLPLYKRFFVEQELREMLRLPLRETLLKPEPLRPEQVHILDVYADALIEKYFHSNFPDLISNAIENLVEASEKKTRYIKPLNTTEAKQKLVMEMYYGYYLPYPLTNNLMGLRLTYLTLPHILNKRASFYAVMSFTGETVKTKHTALPVEKRKLQVKAIASRKGRKEKGVTRQALDEVSPVKKDSQLPLQKTREGQPLDVWLVWRIAGYRKILKIWQTRQTGYPEDRPYWAKPHIEVIVTRRGIKIRKVKRIPIEKIVQFNRDEYLKMIKKFREHH